MAKRETIFVLSLLLFIISSEQAAYDYFQVVLQWQPATCNTGVRCKQTPTNRFSIHGVWPSLTSGAKVKPCKGSAFDPNKIITVRAGLDENWPDLINKKNQRFWSEEWKKHGTCSEEYFNQLQYFAFGLNAYAEQDLVAILRKNKIIPDGSKYQKTDVEQAIKNAVGKKVGLRCNLDKSKIRQLHEISLCYTKNAATLQDCPSNVGNCPPIFKWSSSKRVFEAVE